MAVWSKIDKSICINRKRFDAERFKPDFIKNELLVSSLPNKKLKHFVREITGGATPLGAKYPNFGVPFVRVQNIRANYIDLSDVVYISEKTHNGELFRSQIKPNDVLLTITGVSYGNSSVSYPEMLPANMNQHSVRISLRETLIPEFLSTFLNCKYGRLQSDSKVTGDTRPALTYNEIANYFIPEISIIDQLKISEIVQQSLSNRLNSQLLYQQATDLLNKELGLNDIVFEKKKSYTARISEVIDSRRMNAEYFSPSIKLILKQPFLADSSPLSAIFQIIRGATPSQYYKEGVPVLKTKNVRLPEIDMEKVQDYVLSTSGLVTIEENDLLLASMGVGSLGRMSFIHEIDQKSIVDGTIRILRKKKTTPRNYEIPTLLFLSSKVGQELIYRGIVGSTGIISLPDDYLYRIPIPKFTQELCDNVTTLVKQSIDAKRESKRLLEQAKLRVEQLIEEAANKQ